MPPPDSDVSVAVARLQPVHQKAYPNTAQAETSGAFEAEYWIHKSPFSMLYYVHGMRLTRRVQLSDDRDNAMAVELSAEFGSPTLGLRDSDTTWLRSEGATWAVDGRSKIRVVKDGFALIYGLRWGRQYNPVGANLHMLGFVVGQNIPFGSAVSLQWETWLNMLAYRDWGDDGPMTTERHWTPFRVSLAISPLDRVAVRAFATWWWGLPSGVHLGASFAMRF